MERERELTNTTCLNAAARPTLFVFFALTSVVSAGELSDLKKTRVNGWQTAVMVVNSLRPSPAEEFPGITAWLKDYDRVAAGIDPNKDPKTWKPFDVNDLCTNNPRFWQAYFEIAPADPGLTLLHSGLLASAGEFDRADYVITVGLQRPDIPQNIRRGMLALAMQTHAARREAAAILEKGIQLHDKGKFDEAIAQYEQALKVWPQFGLAYYEIAFSRFQKNARAAGFVLKQGTVSTDERYAKLQTKDVLAAYENARLHDPFQYKAYQGNEELSHRLMVMIRSLIPAWRKLRDGRESPDKLVDDKTMIQFGAACMVVGIHDLALQSSHVLAARRGFKPSDHEFISKNLRALAPGAETESALKKLAGKNLSLRQLIAPKR